MSNQGNYEEMCSKCLDTGYCVISHRSTGGYEGLMKCTCNSHHKDDGYKIPTWDFSLSGVYTKSPPPIEWFKPDEIAKYSTEGDFLSSLIPKIEKWQARKKEAEEYWIKLGMK